MIQVEIPNDYKPRIDLYHRENRNRWYLDYWLPPTNEKRMIVTLPKHYTRAKAVKAKEDKYAQLKEGRLTEKEIKFLPSQLTIDEAMEEYKVATFSGKSDKTKYFDESRVRVVMRYFKETFGYVQFSDIQTEDILKYRQHLENQVKLRKEVEQEYRTKTPFVGKVEQKNLANKLRKTGLAPATARGLLRDLRKVFNGLFKHGKIIFNPYKNIPPLTFAGKDVVRSITPKADELRRLLNAPYESRVNIDFPIKEFVEFLAETGARDDEVMHLEWSDIENGIWHLGHKPNCPTQFGIGWAPKWGKERNIVLTPRALDVLSRIPKYPSIFGYITVPQAERMRARAEGRKIEPIGYPAQFIFTIKDHNPKNYGGRRRVEDYGKTWDMLLKFAGLPDFGPNKLHPHDFRRFKNKQDEYRGKSIRERSENLGHAPEVNQSNYRGEDDPKILAIKAKISQLRFEIGQAFKCGDKSKITELMALESEQRLSLAMILGDDVSVLF